MLLRYFLVCGEISLSMIARAWLPAASSNMQSNEMFMPGTVRVTSIRAISTLLLR
jgi:hypothetical protein